MAGHLTLAAGKYAHFAGAIQASQADGCYQDRSCGCELEGTVAGGLAGVEPPCFGCSELLTREAVAKHLGYACLYQHSNKALTADHFFYSPCSTKYSRYYLYHYSMRLVLIKATALSHILARVLYADRDQDESGRGSRRKSSHGSRGPRV